MFDRTDPFRGRRGCLHVFLPALLLVCLAVLLPGLAEAQAPRPAPALSVLQPQPARFTFMGEVGVAAVTLNRPFRSPYAFAEEQPWRSYHGTLTGLYGGGAVMLNRFRTGIGMTVGSYQGGTFYMAAFLVRLLPAESPIQVHARAGAAVRPTLRTTYDPSISDADVPAERWGTTAGVALTLGQRFIRPRIALDAEYSHGRWAAQSSAGLVVVF